MKSLRAIYESLCITGLVCVAIGILPWILWKLATEPRQWRKPRDVGRGFYEHP